MKRSRLAGGMPTSKRRCRMQEIKRKDDAADHCSATSCHHSSENNVALPRRLRPVISVRMPHMGTPRCRSRRAWSASERGSCGGGQAGLVVGVALPLAMGLVGVQMNQAALRTAENIHRGDAATLASNNAAPVNQYLRRSAKELLDFVAVPVSLDGPRRAADRLPPGLRQPTAAVRAEHRPAWFHGRGRRQPGTHRRGHRRHPPRPAAAGGTAGGDRPDAAGQAPIRGVRRRRHAHGRRGGHRHHRWLETGRQAVRVRPPHPRSGNRRAAITASGRVGT